MIYTDYVYGLERLQRTVVCHKGKLYSVNDFVRSEDSFVLYDKLGRSVYVKGGELDVTPFPLGYVNHYDTCCYTSRIPMRRDWRQGLRTTTLNRLALSPYEEEFEVFDTEHLFQLEDTAQGKYPTFNVALQNVEESHRATAFSRSFAIHETGSIAYKSKWNIGNVEDERRIKLKNEYQFLKEHLVETLNGQPVEVQ